MQDKSIVNTQVAYTNFFLSEILLGVTKIAYITQKKRYDTQADA